MHTLAHTHVHLYTPTQSKEKDASFGEAREEHTGNTSLWAWVITL